jgi:threonine synthase
MNNLKNKGFFKLEKNELKEIKKDFEAVKISDEETLSIIKDIYEKETFMIDPHTATAFGAINKVKGLKEVVALGTAHPYKFFETMKKATGENIEPPVQIKKYLDKEEKFDIIECNISKIKQYIHTKIK